MTFDNGSQPNPARPADSPGRPLRSQNPRRRSVRTLVLAAIVLPTAAGGLLVIGLTVLLVRHSAGPAGGTSPAAKSSAAASGAQDQRTDDRPADEREQDELDQIRRRVDRALESRQRESQRNGAREAERDERQQTYESDAPPK